MDLFRRVFGKNESAEENPPESPNSQDTPVVNLTPPIPSYDTEGQTTRFDGATRELTSEIDTSIGSGHLIFGYTSDVGIVRDNNEDAAFSFFSSSSTVDGTPDFGLFIIADGMGGHQLGERASSLSVKVVAKHVLETIYLPLVTGVNDPDRPPIAEILITAVRNANDTVIREIADGGTTLTVMVVIGEWGHFAHVGDSRIYMINKENAEQITRDHSLVQRLIELNQLSVEDSREHPQRNVLYRAIGQNESIEVDTFSRRLPPNSSLLLCSDGLWDVISGHQIREIIAANPNPQLASDKLVALAITQGSTDNITAIVLKMPSS